MYPTQDARDVDLAFGGGALERMPAYKDIPKAFTQMHNPWCQIASRWFFDGLPKGTVFKPKPGVDTDKALRHIACILRSFEPSHEHKEAGCAFLLAEWFDSIEMPEGK